MAEKVYKFLNDNPVARWSALLLLALAMFCSYIFMDILSPIKDLMQETRGWDSTAFGTMQGSEVFLNVFDQVVRRFRILHGQQPGNLVHQQPQLHPGL